MVHSNIFYYRDLVFEVVEKSQIQDSGQIRFLRVVLRSNLYLNIFQTLPRLFRFNFHIKLYYFQLKITQIDEKSKKSDFNRKSLTSIPFGGPIGMASQSELLGSRGQCRKVAEFLDLRGSKSLTSSLNQYYGKGGTFLMYSGHSGLILYHVSIVLKEHG